MNNSKSLYVRLKTSIQSIRKQKKNTYPIYEFRTGQFHYDGCDHITNILGNNFKIYQLQLSRRLLYPRMLCLQTFNNM